MMAPTTAPPAAPTPAPRLALPFGSLGSVLLAQPAAKTAATRRTDSLRITLMPPRGCELRVTSCATGNSQRATAKGTSVSEAPFAKPLRVGADVNLDAPVQLAAVGRAVGGARLRLTV